MEKYSIYSNSSPCTAKALEDADNASANTTKKPLINVELDTGKEVPLPLEPNASEAFSEAFTECYGSHNYTGYQSVPSDSIKTIDSLKFCDLAANNKAMYQTGINIFLPRYNSTYNSTQYNNASNIFYETKRGCLSQYHSVPQGTPSGNSGLVMGSTAF